jgi:hypothetical protein
MEEKIDQILLDNFKEGDWQTARKQLLDLFVVMASASPNLENIDYNYEKGKYIHKYNGNEYTSVELISFYNLDADKLCEIMLPHLP